jgi:hypothetical protein
MLSVEQLEIVRLQKTVAEQGYGLALHRANKEKLRREISALTGCLEAARMFNCDYEKRTKLMEAELRKLRGKSKRALPHIHGAQRRDVSRKAALRRMRDELFRYRWALEQEQPTPKDPEIMDVGSLLVKPLPRHRGASGAL